MSDWADKNALICCNLKKERVLFFNYFDERECDMIHSAKDISGTKEILNSEKIDYLIIECSDDLIRLPEQLHGLIEQSENIKVVVLVNKDFNLGAAMYHQLLQAADCVLFEPLSGIELKTKLEAIIDGPATVSIPSVIKAVSQGKQSKSPNNSAELWDVFFNDSMQAKLIVNASSKKIVRVNEALLELIGVKQSSVVGQSWEVFDVESNHNNYDQYIKDINSKEKTTFVIHYQLGNVQLTLKAEYQMNVMDGDIVFMGIIAPENIPGVSNDVYQLIKSTYESNIYKADFSNLLDQIKSQLKLDFILFFEYQNNKLKKPVIAGNKGMIKRFLNNSLQAVMTLSKKNKELQFDRLTIRMSENNEILDSNNLQSVYVFPISHHQNLYGTIVAGGQNKIDNWQTSSVVFNALVNHIKFNLFQKIMAEQREIEGLLDKLTGLPNRNSMTKKFAKLIEAGIGAEKYISLMIIDMDKINYYNKNLGIELTNQLIKSLSLIIVNCIRSHGQVYRLSGDEFMVLLKPHADRRLVESLVKALVQKLSQPLLLSNGEDVKIDYNVGISIFPDDGQTVSSMMKNADLAMYDAKLAGKNNYVVFKHSETGQALKQKIEMEENLKIAIESGHIKVFFQPKINALTEDIIGFEALVRWIDPEIGMINPGHFIPLAEETGLINEIGELVARRSCLKTIEWRRKYNLPLTCSINLSVIQLIDPNLPKKLENIINETGIHPHYIDFEITETISLDVVPNLMQSLNEIVAIGCTLSIDDFGTGHSSLDYVKKIPAKYIKIDQSFVFNIGLNPEDEAILDATINIAKRLNREVVAEGVETEEQREYLLDRECEYFQGFLFARPMPEEDIERLLSERLELMGSD